MGLNHAFKGFLSLLHPKCRSLHADPASGHTWTTAPRLLAAHRVARRQVTWSDVDKSLGATEGEGGFPHGKYMENI